MAREYRDRLREIVHRLHHQREVVPTLQRGIGSIFHLESHAIGDTGFLRVPRGDLDRRPVEIEAVDGDVRVPLGERDRGPPDAARDVGHARARLVHEPVVQIGDRGR
jgi:hypothetical protein